MKASSFGSLGISSCISTSRKSLVAIACSFDVLPQGLPHNFRPSAAAARNDAPNQQKDEKDCAGQLVVGDMGHMRFP